MLQVHLQELSILVDGKINKTAMSEIYGPADDPKTIEKIFRGWSDR